MAFTHNRIQCFGSRTLLKSSEFIVSCGGLGQWLLSSRSWSVAAESDRGVPNYSHLARAIETVGLKKSVHLHAQFSPSPGAASALPARTACQCQFCISKYPCDCAERRVCCICDLCCIYVFYFKVNLYIEHLWHGYVDLAADTIEVIIFSNNWGGFSGYYKCELCLLKCALSLFICCQILIT